MMNENSARKSSRRTFLKGAAAAAAGAAVVGAGGYWLGGHEPRFPKRRQEGDRHRHRRHGPAAVRIHDERRPPSAPGPAARGRRLQPAGHQHSAAKPRRLGQLHQRRRPRLARHLRLHPPPPGRAVQAFYAARRKRSAAQTLLRRQGVPFWDFLDAAGVPATFYDLPSNYPPSPSHHGHYRCISGMGTPDMLGTYGTYQHFADDGPAEAARRGRRQAIQAGVRAANTASAHIVGPVNTLEKEPQPAVRRVPRPPRPARRTRPSSRSRARKSCSRPAQWSRWTKLNFELPWYDFASVGGIVRFLSPGGRASFPALRQPRQHGPRRPGHEDVRAGVVRHRTCRSRWGFSTPPVFRRTTTPARTASSDDDEYLKQAGIVLEERLALFDYAVHDYDDGLLFFYFSSSDLQSHMFWWDSDDKHPTRTGGRGEEVLRPRATAVPAARPGRRRPHGSLRRPGDHFRDERPRLRQLRPAVQSELLAARLTATSARPPARRSCATWIGRSPTPMDWASTGCT